MAAEEAWNALTAEEWGRAMNEDGITACSEVVDISARVADTGEKRIFVRMHFAFGDEITEHARSAFTAIVGEIVNEKLFQ